MMKTRWVDLRENRAAGVLRGAVILILLSAASSYAQAGGDGAPQESTKLFEVKSDFELTRPARSLFPRYGAHFDRQPAPLPQTPRRERSIGRKILGAAVGATAGFFAGGYLGAAIEGDCNCDDPGLKGALIGAPIGAATGGILGYKFLF